MRNLDIGARKGQNNEKERERLQHKDKVFMVSQKKQSDLMEEQQKQDQNVFSKH